MQGTQIIQKDLEQVGIEKIDMSDESRDDIPALLIGLQVIYTNQDTRVKLIALLEEHLLTKLVREVERPGLEVWRILVMAVINKGLHFDTPRAHELINKHSTIREFLGHPNIWDEERYSYRMVKKNLRMVSPQLLSAVKQLVVESGHKVSRKRAWKTMD